MGTITKRFGHDVWGPAKTTGRRVFGDRHWIKPFDWNRQATMAGERWKVFPSMCDPFEDHPALVQERIQFWLLIDSTPNLDWLLLTKRPENILKMIPMHWKDKAPANVWYGVSVESENYVGRITELDHVPAVVRFVSYEPALGPVDFEGITELIDWIIIGGESGAGARPFNLDWARNAISHCRWEGIAPFVKQLGSKPVNSAGRPLKLKSYKGDDPGEWPEELKVQEFPVGSRIVVPA
jgi:protein gp37